MQLPTVDVYTKAQKCAAAIDHVLVDELKLQSPSRYLLIEDGAFTWLLAVMDVQNLHGALQKYTNENLRHQLSTAVSGMPVALSNHSGLRYAVLLSGKPQLPRKINFPGAAERNVISFGVGLRGAVKIHARKIVNLIIGGSQDSGKSTALRLLAHVNRMHGAKLYLADPVLHTFNPDAWNQLAAMPVASSKRELLIMIERLQAEVEERSVLFRQAANGGISPEDVDAYNETAQGQAQPLPRVWFIGDEMNTHLGDRVVQEHMADLARVGRKWGVHLALAAHTWRDADIPRGLSALFPSRLCLKVADDTSGRVALNDVRWGRQPLKFRLPGRAVLLANGMYQKLQMYYVTPEQEREWMAGSIDAASVLSDVERRMVTYAVEHGGEFKFREVAVDIEGITEWQARKTAEKWTARGWLELGMDATSARRVSAKLADLAGVSLTGAHASQGITGAEKSSQGPLTGFSQALTGLTQA
jgi:hypothetical protein